MIEITSGALVASRLTSQSVCLMGRICILLPVQPQSQAVSSDICACLYTSITHQLHLTWSKQIIEYRQGSN